MEQEHPGFKWNVTKNSAEKIQKLKTVLPKSFW
jgi:hypothetical protein